MKRLLIVVLLFASGILSAQRNFKPGYYISVSNDTVYGEIDYRGDLKMGKRCTFRKSSGEAKIRILPGEIEAYRFLGSKYFVAREVGGQKVFLEFLVKGKMNIFYLRNKSGEHYYIEKAGEKLTEIPYQKGIVERNNVSYSYETKEHIGILKAFTKDAPSLEKKIEKIDQPSHKNLVELAEDYHHLVCPGNDCIIYKKPVPFLKMNIEFAGGMINYQYPGFSDDKYFFRPGVFTHFWLPRWNEKFYLRTGAISTKVLYGNRDKVYYKIPFQVEYVFPRGRIRPRLAYGYNMYLNSGIYMSLDGGLNFYLSDKISLNLSADLEFDGRWIIPEDKISHSFYAGIIFSL